MTAPPGISEEEWSPQRYTWLPLDNLPDRSLSLRECSWLFSSKLCSPLNIAVARHGILWCITLLLSNAACCTLPTLSGTNLMAVFVEKTWFSEYGVHISAHDSELPRSSLYYHCTESKVAKSSAHKPVQAACYRDPSCRHMLESKGHARPCEVARARSRNFVVIWTLTSMSGCKNLCISNRDGWKSVLAGEDLMILLSRSFWV